MSSQLGYRFILANTYSKLISMSEEFRQDMPPTGGYRLFNWNRTYPKVFWKPGFLLALNIASLGYGYFYVLKDFTARRLTIYFEDADIINAMEPFLLAERDRQVLRIMKKNYQLEKELMKDVPGWKVGTWYGEPIYYTMNDEWIEPIAMEVCGHLRKGHWGQNTFWRQQGFWPWRW